MKTIRLLNLTGIILTAVGVTEFLAATGMIRQVVMNR
ncbi:hypothetical protein Q9233_011167 [Columba guinea]|nr:hypothetical protein Q9233_011167 [Columba guinea]